METNRQMSIFVVLKNQHNIKINELKRRLTAEGCYLQKEKTNHEWWYSPINKKCFSVPRHGAQEVPIGTLKKIAKQSGVEL